MVQYSTLNVKLSLVRKLCNAMLSNKTSPSLFYHMIIVCSLSTSLLPLTPCWDSFIYIQGWHQTHSVAEDGLESLILSPTCLVYAVLGTGTGLYTCPANTVSTKLCSQPRGSVNYFNTVHKENTYTLFKDQMDFPLRLT